MRIDRARPLAPLMLIATIIAGLSCGAEDQIDPHGTLNLEPASFSMSVGSSLTYQAYMSFNSGTTEPQAVGDLNWSSSDITVAIVTKGVATCTSPGSATITASQALYARDAHSNLLCKAQGVAKIFANTTFVKLAAAPVQLIASAQDAGGNAVSNPSLAWSGSNSAVASVTPTGLATPVSPGLATIKATSTADATVSGQALLYVQGNGACSLNPTGIVLKTLTFAVQSDPGNHAAQIGFATTAHGPYAFDFSGLFNSQLNVSGPQGSPFVLVVGGWVQSSGDCAFALNGLGAIGGQPGVGVRLEGTWKNGALSLKLTVGTNGELSGGPTVYAVTG